MQMIGCDLHTRQQTISMLDTATGEVVRMTLTHEGNHVREFYSALPCPVCVGIEATGSMQWFVNLMEELGKILSGYPANPELASSVRFSSRQSGDVEKFRGLPRKIELFRLQ